MNFKKIILFVFIIVTLSSCSRGNVESDFESENIESENFENENGLLIDANDNTPIIYTTIYPIEYITYELVKDFAIVESIVQPGSDPHYLTVTQKDIIDIANSDAFIFLDSNFESSLKDLKETLKNENLKIFEMINLIEIENADYYENLHNHETDEATHTHEATEEIHNHETAEEIHNHETAEEIHNHGTADEIHTHETDEATHTHETTEEIHNHETDEETHSHETAEETHSHETAEATHNHDHDHILHIWLNPINVLKMAEVLKDEFIIMYPEYETQIKTNYEVLKEDLINLDNEYYEQLSLVKNNTFLVSHNVFEQFDKYGIKTIYVKDELNQKDPTTKDIDSLIKEIESNNIKYAVYEKNVTSNILDTISQVANLEKVEMSNLGSRSVEEFNNNLNYIDIMRNNLDILKIILN